MFCVESGTSAKFGSFSWSFKISWGASVGNLPLLTMWGLSPLSAGGEAGAPEGGLAPSDAPRGRGSFPGGDP